MTFVRNLPGIVMIVAVISGCDALLGNLTEQEILDQFPGITEELVEAMAENCTLLPDGAGIFCPAQL